MNPLRILYIAVHSHINWGAEYWMAQAFNDLKFDIQLLDYRHERKTKTNQDFQNYIINKSQGCDLIFLQRGDNLSPIIFKHIKIPIIFWSTEPIKLKTDVDKLLASDVFSWVYVHSYSCKERIKKEFSHIADKTSVIHNAAPKDKISFTKEKNTFAIFNRNLSLRRKYWLWPSRTNITKINDRYGDDYFNDLRESKIAVNIHYSRKSLDDFETGIFEAMASGCVIISERLYKQTLKDLKMTDSIIQVDSPKELKEKLNLLKSKPTILTEYLENTKVAIQNNTWHNRAFEMQKKFQEICN